MATAIDGDLLTNLVRKHQVELYQNPNDRHSHWLKITEEYNKAKGTNVNYQVLAKKLANMKQKDRQKMMADKSKKSVILKNIGDSEDQKIQPKEEVYVGHLDNIEVDDEEGVDDEEYVVEMEDTSELQGDDSGGEGPIKGAMKIIRVVREKGNVPSAKLISAKGVSLDPTSEEAEACTRQGYENLLRDLLTCLAKKYRIEEPCGSSQVKHEIWRQLTNDYLQITGGLVNVSQKEVMRKWTNMKFTSKSKGIPHPLLRAEHLDIDEIERKLKLCQRFVVGDEAIKRVETTKRLEAIKEQVKAKNLEEAAEKEGRPPLKRLERQILTETLRFEQEKIQLLRETAKMEKEKLAMDVKLAEISIEKAKFELELLKRRRLN